MKKLLLLFTTLLTAASLSAQTWNIGSPNAEDVTATLSNDTLYIEGKGEMRDIYYYTDWTSVTTVVIDSGVTTISSGAFGNCNSLNSITIPNSITSIGERAFYNCTSLTSVNIPNSVTSIGERTFADCSGLTSVNIGNSLTTISNAAFRNCSNLTSVNIGSNVDTIGVAAFYRCSSLTSISIPNSVTTISDGAFNGCNSLSSITIPNSVTSIGNAFERCTNLTAIAVTEDNAHYSDNNGVLLSKNAATVIRCPEGKTGTYTIPSSVTTIGELAFINCSGLTSVTIPDGVTTIGDRAFYYSGLTSSVIIPKSVMSIANSAFISCYELTAITVAEDNVNYSANNGVLLNKNADTVIFCPQGKLGAYAIPSSVTAIGNGAFNSCNLTTVTIPNSVTSIGNVAFSLSFNLTSAIIPNSVTTIGMQAFAGCHNLTEFIALNPQPIEIPQNVFVVPPTEYNTTCILKVLAGSVELYRAATGWSSFVNIEAISAYTVTFNAQGGSAVSPFTEIAEGSTIIAPANPTKQGYTFGGWYKEASYATAWDFAEDKVTENITLYAKWVAAPATAISTNAQSAVKLYPNPVANGELRVENEEWAAGEAVEIYNLSGALVAKISTTGAQATLNVSALPSGTYVVKVGKYAGKFVKQ